jgi:hypothetical protein
VIIAGRYPFNDGLQVVKSKYPDLLEEVEEIIHNVDATSLRTKLSKEKGRRSGKMLYNPTALNRAFKAGFASYNWKTIRVLSKYSSDYYTDEFKHGVVVESAFREMDFVKRKLGIEVQFGKYSFMVYNVCAKMTIFNKLGFIDAGIEIVPVKHLAQEMSSGVSYFEQFVWDLDNRGVADIDIPVLIIGVDV